LKQEGVTFIKVLRYKNASGQIIIKPQ